MSPHVIDFLWWTVNVGIVACSISALIILFAALAFFCYCVCPLADQQRRVMRTGRNTLTKGGEKGILLSSSYHPQSVSFMQRDIHLSFAGGQVQVSISADEALRLIEQLKVRTCGREILPDAALAAQAVERARGKQPR